MTSLNPADGSFTTLATGQGEPIGITASHGGRYLVANLTLAGNCGGSNADTVRVIAAGDSASSNSNLGGGLRGASYPAVADGQLSVTGHHNNTVQIFDGTGGSWVGARSWCGTPGRHRLPGKPNGGAAGRRAAWHRCAGCPGFRDDGNGLRLTSRMAGIRRAQQIVAKYRRPGAGSMADELIRERRAEAARE